MIPSHSTTPSVLITDVAWPSIEIEEAVLESIIAEIVVANAGDEEELAQLAGSADAIMTCWQRVTPAVLDAAVKCLIVARYGIGLDNIAVERATELGILVTNVPDFCLDEVSDHAMALLLSIARRTVPFVQETREGIWDPGQAQILPRVRGLTLGLVGYGAIARTLIPKARGFGLNLIVYTPRLTPGELEPGVLATNDLKQLLQVSDFVSLHAPSTEDTRHLIGADALRAMKNTAWLINTSRGALVDEEALAEALDAGELAGAALDVLATEPPPPDHPLLSMPNVLVTPHVAFSSAAAVEDLQ